MAFKGITFAGQNVTPKNDGGLYQAHYGDGILWGCSMAISGDDLVIQSGEFIAGGRVCQVDGATPVDLSLRTLTNGFIQVVMDFDVSKPEGEQWNIHTPLIESATTTFPTLTTDDINNNGNLYQVELAVVQISGGNLTNITSYMRPTELTGERALIESTDASFYPILRMRQLGTTDGLIYYNGAAFIVGNWTDGNGISKTQYYDDGDVYLDGHGILHFRPNSDATGEVQILSNGQITGGHPVVVGTAQSTSASAGTDTRINQISGLVSGGYYHLDGYVALTHNSNVTGHCRLTIANGTSPSNAMISNSMYNVGNSYRYITVSGTFSGYTAYNLAVNCDNATTIRGTRFTAYRID